MKQTYLRPLNRFRMRILLTILLFATAQPLFSQSATPPPAIEVDQIGFYPLAPKCAIVTGLTVRDVFFIVSVGTNSASWALRTDTAFIGRLGPVIASANSSLSTRYADFSAFRRPGLYRVSRSRSAKLRRLFDRAGTVFTRSGGRTKGLLLPTIGNGPCTCLCRQVEPGGWSSG